MPGTRNENLALAMGWELQEYQAIIGVELAWFAPSGEMFRDLPNFANDDCAAVKWLLPFLWKVVLRVDLFTTKDGCRLEIPKLFREKKQSGFHGTSISLALAAAVESLKSSKEVGANGCQIDDLIAWARRFIDDHRPLSSRSGAGRGRLRKGKL